MKKFIRSVVGLLMVTILGGCYATVGYVVPAPPPPQEEVMVVSPFAGAIWVPGEWRWQKRHHEYYWHRGYWRHP